MENASENITFAAFPTIPNEDYLDLIELFEYMVDLDELFGAIPATWREDGVEGFGNEVEAIFDKIINGGYYGYAYAEIYNTVSGEKHSNRPYSGLFVDQMANRGILYPLFAADDVHYYEKDGTSSAIIVSLPELTREGLIEAIRNRDFYAVSGGKDAPFLEVRDCGNTIHIACSPVSEVNIFTNLAWAKNRHLVGEDITEADYPCVIEGRPRQDRWIRVEVTDRDGRRAYSNLISKAEQIGE